MRRKILLSSLTVGRCFKVIPPDIDNPPDVANAEDGQVVQRGRDMMDYDHAWKVTAMGEEGASAVSAGGREGAFSGETVVVEVPRQGYDRLVERANKA